MNISCVLWKGLVIGTKIGIYRSDYSPIMNYFKHTIARMSYWLMSSWPASYFKGKAMSVKMVSFSIGSERYTSCVFFWSEKWKLLAVRELFYPSSSFRRKRFWYDAMQRRTAYFLAPFFLTWISLLFIKNDGQFSPTLIIWSDSLPGNICLEFISRVM